MVRFELAGIVHFILVQVPEIFVKDPVFGTEALSAGLIALTATQFAVILLEVAE